MVFSFEHRADNNHKGIVLLKAIQGTISLKQRLRTPAVKLNGEQKMDVA